jgi:hypothetical protein
MRAVNMISARRVKVSVALALLVGVGSLTGCSPIESPEALNTPSAQRTTPTPSMAAEPDHKIATTCAMLSIVDSTTNNALVDVGQGAISTDQYATIVNTIPHTLTVIQRVSPGLAAEMDALVAAIPESAPIKEGATFNPDGLPYRDKFQSLRTACDENGTGVAVIPTISGG